LLVNRNANDFSMLILYPVEPSLLPTV
jgi:hypothetical protein